ncbi:MAG TPA: hypothetical protein VEW42_00475 [Candidatus Eisenbacteria bacterium]|nr:hypothetical protein [Candidatus Eisenbacteria bacterium]
MNKKIIQLFRFSRKNWYTIATLFILLFTIFLRFYHYDMRWGFAYDQIHDALVARYALLHFTLPILGPFSSAGPFVTGPEWYWLIILGMVWNPWWILSPWIFITLMYCASVYLLIYIGQKIGGKTMGIIVGLFVATSAANISQSVNLTNQSPIAVYSAISLFCLERFFATKKSFYLFLTGLSVGIAVNTHLEGVLLIPLLIGIGMVGRISFKYIFFMTVGLLIPFTPLITFDVQHHFFNTHNMLQYYLHDQYNVSLDVLGRNWKTYIFLFWPKSLAGIIGGYTIVGYGTAILLIASIVFFLIKDRSSKTIGGIIFALVIAVFFMRYSRTPLYESYLMYLHPWVFILVGYILTKVYKKYAIITVCILVVLITGSVLKVFEEINFSTNTTYAFGQKVVRTLTRKYPHKKFSFYDYHNQSATLSSGVSLTADMDGLVDEEHGMRIGIAASQKAQKEISLPVMYINGVALYTLDSLSKEEFTKQLWFGVSSKEMYHATQEWFAKERI